MRRQHAFTLVELLVVIGIIAVLIALLMPALSGARECANRAKCLATLRSMHQAAVMHAQEHHGYMPVAGVQTPREMGVFATPEGLLDVQRRKYMYYADSEFWRPAPLPVALGHYMGLSLEFGGSLGWMKLDTALRSDDVFRPFSCPSQPRESIRPGPTVRDIGWQQGPKAYMSYVFNGGFLARIIHPWGETPAGNLTRVRHPADVFLFADGNNYAEGSVYGIHPGTDIHDTFDSCAFSNQYDYTRHRGRINVVFVDGHGETLRLPDPTRDWPVPGNLGDLKSIGVTKGIFD